MRKAGCRANKRYANSFFNWISQTSPRAGGAVRFSKAPFEELRETAAFCDDTHTNKQPHPQQRERIETLLEPDGLLGISSLRSCVRLPTPVMLGFRGGGSRLNGSDCPSFSQAGNLDDVFMAQIRKSAFQKRLATELQT